MSRVSVKLSAPVELHGRRHESVTIRRPSLRDYFELGEIESFVTSRAGLGTLVADHDTLRAYAQRLVVEPAFEELALLPIEDARAIAEAIKGFFAVATAKDSPPSPTPSPSASDTISGASST